MYLKFNLSLEIISYKLNNIETMPYVVFCLPYLNNFESVSLFCTFDQESHAVDFCSTYNSNDSSIRFFYIQCPSNPTPLQVKSIIPSIMKQKYEGIFANCQTSQVYPTYGAFKRSGLFYRVVKYNNESFILTQDYRPNRANLTLSGPPNRSAFDFPDESIIVNITYG